MPTATKQATDWQLINKVIDVHPAVLLYGPPGTGKTFAATHGIERDKVFSVTLTEETPAAELRGHFIPSENGEFKWHDGPAIRAWRTGGRLVINEINRGSGDAITFLYAVADDPEFAMLTLPTGETVRPEPGFSIVATMNGDPEELPEALSDRFSVQMHVTQMHPNAVLSLAEDLRTAATNSIDSPDRMSTRRWKAFQSLRAGLSEQEAAAAVFGVRGKSILDSLKIATAAKPTGPRKTYNCWICKNPISGHVFRDPRDNDRVCGDCFIKADEAHQIHTFDHKGRACNYGPCNLGYGCNGDDK